MEPERISAEQWEDIQRAVVWLWLATGFVIVCAGSLLISLAIVPSSLGTRSLPDWTRRLRPVFLVAAAVAFLAAIVSIVFAVVRSDVAYDIYERVWI